MFLLKEPVFHHHSFSPMLPHEQSGSETSCVFGEAALEEGLKEGNWIFRLNTLKILLTPAGFSNITSPSFKMHKLDQSEF